MKKIIAFSGSNSSQSIHQAFIHYAVGLIDCEEIEIEVLDLRDFDAPIYGIDLEQRSGIPNQIQKLKDKLDSAHAYIIASPEYNGMMPAFFKNIIDWLSRIDQKIFNNKDVVLLSASPGANGGATNLSHLASVMPHWGGRLVGKLSVGSFNQFLDHGKLTLPEAYYDELYSLLNRMCARLVVQPADTALQPC